MTDSILPLPPSVPPRSGATGSRTVVPRVQPDEHAYQANHPQAAKPIDAEAKAPTAADHPPQNIFLFHRFFAGNFVSREKRRSHLLISCIAVRKPRVLSLGDWNPAQKHFSNRLRLQNPWLIN